MAYLTESNIWETGIYQLETSDVVQGGSAGIDNLQPRQLANRTTHLKSLFDYLAMVKLDAAAIASQAQAEDGTDNTKWMSPLRVAQAIAALATVAMATDTAAGKVELATSAETISGIDTQRATHPAGVKAAINAAVSALVNSSPATLDTLNELAAAIGNDPNFATSIAAQIGGKQNADATLTALAGMTVAANKLIYAIGADAFSTTDFTAFARSLLDDADAASARATLGAQASDPTLTALAGLSGAADRIPFFNGPDTAELATLTAFARTLLDDADAAAARATLGAPSISDLASVAGLGVGQAWQSVTRSAGVGYTNSTGKPIVFYCVQPIGCTFQMTIGGVALYAFTTNTGYAMNQSYVIPAGATYSFTCNGTLLAVAELR